MLKIVSFVLGPVETNAYLIADTETGEAAAIDPAWDGQTMVEAAQERGWEITQIWVTHAHVDHMAGAAAIVNSLNPKPAGALPPSPPAGGRPDPRGILPCFQGPQVRRGDDRQDRAPRLTAPPPSAIMGRNPARSFPQETSWS